jgi:hypothetical protein
MDVWARMAWSRGPVRTFSTPSNLVVTKYRHSCLLRVPAPNLPSGRVRSRERRPKPWYGRQPVSKLLRTGPLAQLVEQGPF